MKTSVILRIVGYAVLLVGLFFVFACSSEPKAEAAGKVESAKTEGDSANALPKMLDLGSVSCIPCKQMAPILDSLKVIYEGKAEITFIDVRDDQQSARKYGITMIPTQIFFDRGGQEVYRHIGFFPADSITAHLAKLGVEL